MNHLLHLLLLLPVAGFLLSLVIREKSERLISYVAVGTIGLHFLLLLTLTVMWIAGGFPVVDMKDLSLFQSVGYEYFIDLHFDEISAVYAGVGSSLSFLVAIYSRVYLHRERGYKRFFNTILFFFFGYNVIIFSGNLETLFIGWEILGISSFLLIAFYRERYLPVKNAVKIYSIYRLGDIGLILAMWMSHHLFHENITFMRLQNADLVSHHLESHTVIGVFISLMILVAAAVKSAQLPFSSWLPRAMEGPTPSSAIFYGSLSVHLGVFILLRTFPFWEHQLSVRILIAVLGLGTALLAASMARVQSVVKSQIAYASIAQIGIIFVEVAAGLETLALVHFAGNAFMRTYQLLVSPSVVSYLIREQFYTFTPRPRTVEDSFPRKLMYTLYMLSLKEWNLDTLVHRAYREPIKTIGRKLKFLNFTVLSAVFAPLFVAGVFLLLREDLVPSAVHPYLPTAFAFVGMLFVFRSYTERQNAALAWTLVIMNHFWIALAVSFNEHFGLNQVVLYLGGVLLSGLLGYAALWWLHRVEGNVNLDRHHGHSYVHPRLALLFFAACLGLTGFPITPTFVGEDLIFSHIHENQVMLVLFVAVSLIVDGLSIIRIYAKLFLGLHQRGWHAVAYKSS
jgi:NADH:ubiquinone oxidoreductase subunit 5 (subunit L)/multisubunit Na+/H+ antiporter MnhA subunit